MNIFVYLDESGSIHKNSKCKYFAVGGYFTFYKDKNKITSLYKKINKKVKIKKHYKMDKELKSINMSVKDKKLFFKEIQKITDFYGFCKVFFKENMKKEIVESNIFFNYAIKLVFQDCILPLLNLKKLTYIYFVVNIDNRNIRVGDLKNLENYLNIEFYPLKITFSVTYYDSKTHFGIQLADLIVNTFYNFFKKKEIIKDLIPIIDFKKFRISLFPGYNIFGRRKKISLK